MSNMELNAQLFERVMRLPQAMRMRMFAGNGEDERRTLERRPQGEFEGPWQTMPHAGMPPFDGRRDAGPGGRRGPGRGPEGPEGPDMRGPGRHGPGCPGRDRDEEDFGGPGRRHGPGHDRNEEDFGGPGRRHGPGCPGRDRDEEDFEEPGRRGPMNPAAGRPVLSRERALSLLLENENGLRQKEIGEKLHIGPSATSEFMDRLQEAGYVERTVDPDDKRATRIVLTELGKARACELKDEQNDRLEQMFGALTDDEKRQLITLIDKLLGVPARRGPTGEMYKT